MSPESALPERIIVAGSGVVALSAALLLRRAVPGATILLVETPPDPDALTDRTTRLWPIADALHVRIGLDPLTLLRAANASVHSADRFERWGQDQAWLLPTDCEAIDAGLFQHWLRTPGGALAGLVPEAVLAERDLVADELAHLRVDPVAYRALLSRGIEGAGIALLPLAEFAVERGPDGRVAALVGGGERIAADWFVDATGVAARIAGVVAPARTKHPAACDIVAFGRDEPPRGAAFDRWRTTATGWIAHIPGARASRTVMGFSSASSDPADAARRFRTETGSAPDHVVAFSPGTRAAWTGNVLALGEAAVEIDAIGGLGLALAQSALVRLAAALPGRDCPAIGTAEFNRRTCAEQDAAADFVALHYHTPRAGPFWEHARSIAPSEPLARLLDQFARHGRIPHRDDDPVPGGSWRALLVGVGICPPSADAITRSQPLAQSQHIVTAARERAALATRAAIPYRAWHDLQLRSPK